MSANVAQPERSHSNQPGSKQTGSESKHFARRGGVPFVRRKTRYVVCASVDAPFTCREARRSARRETRVSARRETRCSARRKTRRSARRETRCSARRETRRSARRKTRRSARRETRRFCARDVPSWGRVRARKTCRVRAACAPARPCFCGRRASPT